MAPADSAWPRYCQQHGMMLDTNGRCSLCALTDIDPSRIRKAGDHEDRPPTLPDRTAHSWEDTPPGRADDDDDWPRSER